MLGDGFQEGRAGFIGQSAIGLESRRRLGAGGLQILERRAAELGATEIVLDTNERLEAAQSLYRSSGYVEVEPYNDNPNATHWFRKVILP